MSNKFVRDTIKAAWSTLVPGITLVEVENIEPKGMVAPWAALDFSVYANDRDSLGENACWLEEGEINVFIYVDSGTGNQDLITFSQSVLDAFLKWEDATGSLKAVRVLPMEEFPTSSGLWWGANVGITYEYRYFK